MESRPYPKLKQKKEISLNLLTWGVDPAVRLELNAVRIKTVRKCKPSVYFKAFRTVTIPAQHD